MRIQKAAVLVASLVSSSGLLVIVQATHIAAVTNAMAALSQQFPGEELLLALGGQEVRQWLGGMLVATHSGIAAGRQPAVQEVAAMDLSVSLPDHGGPPASAPCL